MLQDTHMSIWQPLFVPVETPLLHPCPRYAYTLWHAGAVLFYSKWLSFSILVIRATLWRAPSLLTSI
jgi:hypothetical protein